jgi:phosphate acetyltransferase
MSDKTQENEMNALSRIKEKARQKKRRVVLPEGTEPRTINAAKKILSDSIASIALLGDNDKIKKLSKDLGLNLKNIEVIDPTHSPKYNQFVSDFMEMRKHKNITEKEAKETIANSLYFGAMLVHNDMADASVAGAVNTTGDVIRAAIQVLGLKEGINTISSCFMMTLPHFGNEYDKILLYADGAVMPNPTSDEMVSIAASTAETMKNILDEEPRVAFLSFSTKGSANHPDVDKVVKAVEKFKVDYPDIKADGEFQLDTALIPEIAKSKAPGSDICGDANILIFPNLDAGNIGYKLTQRLANATATGPIIQGLTKPANDLSRGCTAEDIVDVTAIAVLMKG